MTGITLILANDGLFGQLLPRSDCKHRRPQHRHTIKVERREDISFSVRMWFSLFGVQYSSFSSPRSRHLEPGYTYVVRGRDNADGVRFVRHRPEPGHQRIYEDEPRPGYRQHDDHHAIGNHDLRDFGPPDMPPYEYEAQHSHHHPSLPKRNVRCEEDDRYHDIDQQLRLLKSKLEERNHSVPMPTHPPLIRHRDNSPGSVSSSSSSSSKTSSKKSDRSIKSQKEQERAKAASDGRRVRFAGVEDYLDGMYDAPLPTSRLGYGYGGSGGSRWEDRPCFDESQGGYGVVREPKRRYPGSFEI